MALCRLEELRSLQRKAEEDVAAHVELASRLHAEARSHAKLASTITI